MNGPSPQSDPPAAARTTNDEQALLLFSFGPVQPFIAAARKTADLRAGSTLLSRLAREALAPVREACGDAAVIFPHLSDANGERTAAPNRFVAVVPNDEADALAHQAEVAVQSALYETVTDALDEANVTASYPRALGEQQAETFLETYWSILPLRDDEPYGEQYSGLERLLGARKATRDFEAHSAPGYRCDLIPKLAALVPDPESRPGETREYWSQKARSQPPSRLREGEELSAVGLAKRFVPGVKTAPDASEAEAFPSTSSLAAADFKADVLRAVPDNEALREAVEAYEAAMEPLLGDLGAEETPIPKLEQLAREAGVESFHTISGEWLLEESFDPDRLKRQGLPVSEDIREEEHRAALGALRSLLKAAGDSEVDPPSRYYALLLLDGDRMGMWLSGEKAPIDGPVDEAYHRAVSRALGRFAEQEVPRITQDEHLGRLVYSGGDDVLAFVSLRHALPMARAVRAAFSGQLDDDGAVRWEKEAPFTEDLNADAPTLGNTASASAGLVFAHHMQPLDQVLDRARAAERVAKDELGRNALACALMKRSGEHLTAGDSWSRNGIDLVGTLRTFADFLRDGSVSTGFLHTIRNEVPTLSELEDSAVRAEVQRIFFRQSDGADEDNFTQTVGALLNLTGDRNSSLQAAAELLTIAQFIGTDGAS